MNNTVKYLLGATIGASFGYFVGAVIVEIIRQQEELEEEVTYSIEEERDGLLNLDDPRPPLKKEKVVKLNQVKNYTEFFKGTGRPDLAKLAAKYNGDPVVLGDSEEPEPEDVLTSDDLIIPEDVDMPQTDPSIISLSEFANADGYHTVTLSYYDDDVVTDEHDNPIERPERLLGEEALVSFGHLSEDEDVVYVRNELKKCMYEVVRLNKDYSAPAPRRIGRQPLSKKKVDVNLLDEEEYNGEEQNT